jgi:protein-L-isoaspartate(D-aspartate) O-methyltransferase
MSVELQDSFEAQRASMVEQQLRSRGICDERLLQVMGRVPRQEFLSPAKQQEAYLDQPVAIGEQQTTSQPYIIAAMLQAAEVGANDRVLEIGAGSGYQTAILAELAERVLAVERLEGLAASAQAILRRLGYQNIEIVVADGSLGWAPGAPYNVIVVSAASPSVPPALIDQLAPGGRLIIPVGQAREQMLQLVLKQQDSGISMRVLEGCRFVPMIGEQGFAA